MSAALALALSTSFADDDVLGRWQTVDDETNEVKSVVELFLEKDRLYGRVVELVRAPDEDPDPACKKCPGQKQGQKIIGMTIIDGLRWDGEAWSGGTILDPESGKVYDTKLWLDGEMLKVRGYLGIFFRTQVWQRG